MFINRLTIKLGILLFYSNLSIIYIYIKKKKIYLSKIRLKFIISTTNLAENVAIRVSAERFGRGGKTIPGLELTGNDNWLQRYMS